MVFSPWGTGVGQPQGSFPGVCPRFHDGIASLPLVVGFEAAPLLPPASCAAAGALSTLCKAWHECAGATPTLLPIAHFHMPHALFLPSALHLRGPITHHYADLELLHARLTSRHHIVACVQNRTNRMKRLTSRAFFSAFQTFESTFLANWLCARSNSISSSEAAVFDNLLVRLDMGFGSSECITPSPAARPRCAPPVALASSHLPLFR